MTRRGATALSGVLPVDKPSGMTSHDVVAAVRRATGERRIGHAGTLDPLATGLLVVLVGPMTRLARFFTEHPKTYVADIEFGTETDTEDAEGAVIRTVEVDPALVDETRARRALAGLLGPQMQHPPAYSAIKVAGRKAYDIARRGGETDLPPRAIEVYEAELLSIDPGPPLTWRAEFTVSSGTYVRSLARDLGRASDSAAHLSGLRRTSSGGLQVADALTLDEVATAGAEGRVPELFTDPIAALGIATLVVDPETAAAVTTGARLDASAMGCDEADIPDGGYAAIARDGRLLAIHERHGDMLRPLVVLPSPVPATLGPTACENSDRSL